MSALGLARAWVVILVVCVAGAASAQEPQGAREGGSPQQAAAAAGGSLLAAVPQVLLGGVPKGEATATVLPLSLAEAVARGLEQNLGILVSEQSARAAAGHRAQAVSLLLPNAALRLSQSRQKANLQEFGIPLMPEGSPVVGPFNVAVARLNVSQALFDYSAIQGARAGSLAAAAAGHSFDDVRDQVAFVVSSQYLQAVIAASRIDAARAQLKTAQALYDRAVTMRQAGIVAGIDVIRAQVQVQAQEQRVIFYENEHAKTKLALQRAIGVPLAQPVELTDAVAYAPLDGVTLDGSLALARESREDLQAASAQLRSAEAAKQAAIGAGLPSVRLSVDVGRSSNAWDSLLGSYAVSAAVAVPVFQGGRVRGRVVQADAQVQQQRAQVEDLRARIEYEVRSAWLDVEAADRRAEVAKSALDLATRQLAQADDRFAAGVTSHIEVVQAQEALATATENHLSALFAHNLAKLSLARATGTSEARAGRK